MGVTLFDVGATHLPTATSLIDTRLHGGSTLDVCYAAMASCLTLQRPHPGLWRYHVLTCSSSLLRFLPLLLAGLLLPPSGLASLTCTHVADHRSQCETEAPPEPKLCLLTYSSEPVSTRTGLLLMCN